MKMKGRFIVLNVFILVSMLLFNLSIVSGFEVPNSNVKTIEFFIGQDTTQIASATNKDYTFKFNITEKFPLKKYTLF